MTIASPISALTSLTPDDIAAVPAEVVARIRGARNVLAVCHENPEADALGSALAVALAVEELGGRATPVCADVPPAMYDFMPRINLFRQDPDPGIDYDLIVVGDCGDLERIGPVLSRNSELFGRVPIVDIDHHISNAGFGVVDWIDATAAATCEIECTEIRLEILALAFVEEAGVVQPAARVVDVLLVQRPADALRGAALVLAFDIGRIHRLAGILDDGVAQNFGRSGFGIDLDIANVRGEGHARAIGDDLVMAGDGATGIAGGGGDVFQRQRRQVAMAVALGLGVAVLPDDILDRDVHHLGGPVAQYLDGVAAGKHRRHARREGAAAAIGHVVVAETAGIGDVAFDLGIGNAELLGRTNPRFGPGWTIGGWFIPVANMVLGLGLLLSAINVRYRDVRYMIPVFLQVLPLLSGVMFAVDQIPEKWQWILSLNPMTGVISGWRWAMLDAAPPDLDKLAVGVAVALVLFLGGLAVFRASEPRFADTI